MNMRCAHNGQDLAIVMPSHNLCILIVENLVDLVDSNHVSKMIIHDMNLYKTRLKIQSQKAAQLQKDRMG